jgi:hypothetical protein
MIFIYSSHANESEHVESEIDRAYNKRIPIIPLRIEEVPLSGSLEYYLSTAQWFDAFPPIEKHLEKLPAVVKRLLNKDADAASENKEPPPRPLSAGLEPQSQKRSFFSSTAFKIIAGLVLVGIIAAVRIIWFLSTTKTEIQVTSDKTPAPKSDVQTVPTNGNALTVTNEIIVDARNKLVWTKYPANADVNWDEAVKYCEELSLGGLTDWRLPAFLDLKATNDLDIPKAEKVWTAIDFDEPCCYWTSTEDKDRQRMRVFNENFDIQSLSKENKEDMNALCVHRSGK